ncbi:MAG: BLUF domain-containing protein [Gillisia sp.]
MRHAISYVSTAATELSVANIKFLLKDTEDRNNSLDISGFLVCSEGNFFQMLEGETAVILEIFSKISEDPRHHNLIKIVDKQVQSKPFGESYFCSLIGENALYPRYQVQNYLRYTQVLDQRSQNAVQRILEAMII